MKSIKSATLNYPIVIRKVLNDLVIAVPDLGYWQTIPFNQIQKSSISLNSDKSATQITEENLDKINLSPIFFEQLNKALESTWNDVELHRLNKKWVPAPSTFKSSIQKSEKDFTLPAFTAELQKYMNISENTVRREIKRGAIQCYTTEGHHRRIPFAELELYLNRRYKVSTSHNETLS